jgi:uncharacterized protein DUF1707/cell wall-active antibiotic response 4TMS protein YvqF
MRISDADRDRAAAVLSEAMAEGRLTAEEHSERLDAIYAARTGADIAPIVSDLPGAAGALAPAGLMLPQPVSAWSATPAGKPARMISIFSGTEKKGAWQVPADIDTVNVFGGTSLDLRQAVLPGNEIRIRAICVFGGVDITVPPEMTVIDSGFSLFGGRDTPSDSDEAAQPGAPVLRLHGICIVGGISVSRKRRKGDRIDETQRRLST